MNGRKKVKFSLVKIIFVLLIIALLILIPITYKHYLAKKQAEQNQLNQEAQLNNNLYVKLLSQKHPSENFVFSPLSIRYALAMLKDGSAGTTKTQLESAIGTASLPNYNNLDSVLSVANSIFIRNNYQDKIKESYKNTLANKYNAEIKYDSFENASNINSWIENKTFGMIKNMVPDSTAQNPNTKMLLVNALAINMSWKNNFSNNTKPQNFNYSDGTTSKVSTMTEQTSSDDVSYYKNDSITSFSKDLQEYNNTKLQFIAIMPNSDLENYTKKITVNDINTIVSNSTPASKASNGVEISIPKFSMDCDYKGLNEDLLALGIINAFSQSADFSEISDSDITLNDVIHTSKIVFEESGIKAAASTVIGLKSTAPSPTNNNNAEQIKIDKPFLFLIRDKDSGEIWFTGTVYKPEEWKTVE